MEKSIQVPAKPRHRRRWYSYSLRTLLLLTAIAAAVLGVWVNRAERQRRAVAAIREAGGDTRYDFQFDSKFNWIEADEPSSPFGLCKILGVDYFADVVFVQTAPTTTDAGLAHLSAHLSGLKNLRDLNLYHTQITDAGLVYLIPLASLKCLTLSATQITDAGLVHLTRFSTLEILRLDESQITDAALVHLGAINTLTDLSLFGAQITDAGLVHLSRLANLQDVLLSDTQITDAGLVHLRGLENLQFLYLDGTPVTDAGLVHLSGLGKLKWLSLVDTNVRDAGCNRLQQALPNCRILR